MSEMKSPLARLVLFLVALSLSGGIVAGIAASVLAPSPQNPAPAAPANDVYSVYLDCVYGCMAQYGSERMDEVLACGKVCRARALDQMR
jgi:hypothetical protein